MGLFDKFKSKPASSSADNVTGIMVTLEIGGEQALFVLLSKDGSINRLGTGSEGNTEKDMFIGVADTTAFEAVRAKCGPIIDQWLGGFGAPDIAGKPCKLAVGFQTTDGTELVSQWQYGTESQGPPPDVAAVVIKSVQATEDWYQKQKAMAAGAE